MSILFLFCYGIFYCLINHRNNRNETFIKIKGIEDALEGEIEEADELRSQGTIMTYDNMLNTGFHKKICRIKNLIRLRNTAKLGS